MTKKLQFIAIIAGLFLPLCGWGQQTLQVRVNSALDDLEEFIAGPGLAKPLGSLDAGSSDLELGSESRNNVDPQLVGIRFANISIPKGSIISRAYIQFTVDATNKNSDPAKLDISMQDEVNPLAFDDATPFNISSRKRLKDSVIWEIAAGGWTTVGEAGPDQRTPNLAGLLQTIVNKDQWASGNAVVFLIKGVGTREVESFDGSPDQAPLLVVEFLPVSAFSARVSAAEDDLEEFIAGPGLAKPLGSLDAGSSDLELGSESRNNVDPQLVGIRFRNVSIPQGAQIQSAYIQFTVDATNKNTDPAKVDVSIQDDVAPLSFDDSKPFNISSRKRLKDSVIWEIPAGSWATVGEAGADQRTPNLASLVQAIVNKQGWASGNALAFLIKGVGTREAESFDGSPDQAPLLVVNYINVTKVSSRISAAEDDLEEFIAGPGLAKPLGSLDAGSSDLELGSESRNNVDPQLVGMRFNKLDIPQGATIQNAYIQFTVDATNKNTDPSNLFIYAQDDLAPLAFDDSKPFNISSRPQLNDSVAWNIPAGSWATVGEAGADQRSADIKQLVQALVNKAGWQKGGSMAFFIKGVGTREAESYDGSPDQAPLLVIEYLGGGEVEGPKGNPISAFPIATKDSWSYWDQATNPGADWNKASFDDSKWPFGPSAFGYGRPLAEINTPIAFGADAANKPISSYFRKKFTVDTLNKLSETLELLLRKDDGAIVYINDAEVLRVNMPAGAVAETTPATAELSGNAENAFFTYDIPRSALKAGENLVAVEIHLSSASSPDMFFDLILRNASGTTNPVAQGCDTATDNHISCFTSVIPRPQNDTLQIPFDTHAFQYIAAEGDAYTVGGGNLPGVFDFTGYVPIEGSSRNGYLSINHELDPVGGVSILDLNLDFDSGLWKVTKSQPVDFTGVVKTERNCSGTVTPWNTVITCEETYDANNTDLNGDGYADTGWCIEIDPKTGKVLEYGTGKPQKLWALGRMSHENVVVAKDNKTVYFGEDDPRGGVYKFVAAKEADLTSGDLYALKLDGTYANGEASSATGVWVKVPNTTPAERNEVKAAATALGATLFNGVEDVEINPLNGEIVFSVKGVGRIYRFKDDGTTISAFETYAGGKAYRINTGNGVVTEDFGLGIDNLTYDDRGNLYGLQDGGRNHVWMLANGHTNANPKVEMFMQTTFGAEPTGMTFTPDFRYMFISVQGPAGTVAQKDVSGKSFVQGKSFAIVIARKEYLGVKQVPTAAQNLLAGDILNVYPNPASGAFQLDVNLNQGGDLRLGLYDVTGKQIRSIAAGKYVAGTHNFVVNEQLAAGMYLVRLENQGKVTVKKLVVR